jgi:hypothetical protein
MGVRILQGDQASDGAILYCSVSMWAFGPVFEDHDKAQAFLDWLGSVDPRSLTEKELEDKYSVFLRAEG